MSSQDQAGPAAPVRADLPAPNKMLKGRNVYRVVWKLHTDVLVGYCWCDASHEDIDPITLWEWLLAHPDTHSVGRADSVAPDPDPEGVSA
ncbi:hypothetical protein [Streptomyces spiralis]|uniref:hypothetical protein n=1 Tax=Streptomyces spiralis TaxID=66376 RepID=UPI0033FB4A5D